MVNIVLLRPLMSSLNFSGCDGEDGTGTVLTAENEEDNDEGGTVSHDAGIDGTLGYKRCISMLIRLRFLCWQNVWGSRRLPTKLERLVVHISR